MTNELGRLTGIISWGLYHIFFSINTLLYAYTFLHKKLGVVANLKKKKPIISLVVSLILFPLNMNSRPLESVRQVLPKLICSDSTDILKYFWCASDYISNSDNYRKQCGKSHKYLNKHSVSFMCACPLKACLSSWTHVKFLASHSMGL